MARKWYNGDVVYIESASPHTKIFRIKIQSEEIFDFEAGQFIIMDLPIGDKRLQRWRSYSIANAPDQTNILEFCVVDLEGGIGTTYLFEEAEIGTTIKFKGPEGGFTLPKNLNRTNVFISTGTGVAPFRSMIQHIQKKSLDFNRIHLIFGTRHESGILYRDEMKDFAQLHDDSGDKARFKYSVALSRDQNMDVDSPFIHSSHGYVHPIYLQEYADVSPDTHFYICGWSQMIDDAVANLIVTLRYPKEQIHYELYG